MQSSFASPNNVRGKDDLRTNPTSAWLSRQSMRVRPGVTDNTTVTVVGIQATEVERIRLRVGRVERAEHGVPHDHPEPLPKKVEIEPTGESK